MLKRDNISNIQYDQNKNKVVRTYLVTYIFIKFIVENLSW